MKKQRASVLSVIALAAMVVGPVHAQDQASDAFYSGKTISLMVGYTAGGGYDTYSRTLARHISKYIPGHPEVVVKNVPGAGSLVLFNQIANTLPSDGTVFASVGRGQAFEPLFGNEQSRFDPTELNWLGSLNNETSLCVAWEGSGVDKWQDLKKKSLTVGATGAGSDPNLFPRVLRDLFGFKFDIISGYPGGNDIMLAMERGEVKGRCGWSWSSAKATRHDWIKQLNDGEGKINILIQLSLKKHPDLPNVPLVTELAETEKQRQVLQLLFARQVMGRPYVAPPGVPEERVALLRRALAKTVEDPDFLKDARNQNLGINFVSGEEIQDIVQEAYQYPAEIVDFVKDAKAGQ